MDVRYYPESDGGDFWTGSYWSRQPKTYYVVDAMGGERIECDSWKEAESRARKLNRDWQALSFKKLFEKG